MPPEQNATPEDQTPSEDALAQAPTPPTGIPVPQAEPGPGTAPEPVAGSAPEAAPGSAAEHTPDPASSPGPAPEPAAGLAPEPVPPVPPRSFTTRGDLIATAVITVGVLVAGLLVWTFSDARATTSQTSAPLPILDNPVALPPTFGEVWRAGSANTSGPVTTAQVVVTAEGGAVLGREPLSGEVKWRYQRDLPLCTVAPAFGQVLAVYRRGETCSEVTALDPATGKRGAQRNGDAEAGTRLLNDGTHLTTTGKQYLEGWRSDLVKTQEYGQVRAMVQPGKQPRVGCTYGSVSVTANRVGVIEHCPDDPADRLTVFKPNPKDFDKPEVYLSTVVNGRGARLVGLGPERAAVLLANPTRLAVYDANSSQVAEIPLNLPPTDPTGDPEGGVVPTTTVLSARCTDGSATPLTFAATSTCPSGESATTAPAVVYWWTGSRTIALAATTMTPLWTIEGTLGPGTLYAGRLVLPTPAGLLVADPNTGTRIGQVAVDRAGHRGEVELATSGPVLLEQRGPGGVVVALR
ncbi:hypothetical protein JOF53_005401 [Crossiella equi]|uniref:PQQ-binding-like beta-propeller repeat protein n=1 Tax=Crossiella equi TaxID=130796 RepID=A0ABS5AJZ3_9PSEU|nr:PQQ-binding-like beta-propeller repeat protein [Crossiella equi]MBP2476529.1 hypothetical protein [Crossiella equi]